MSTESHITHASSKSEHGTTRSYIIGFILSLILTINPYFLVVTKTVTGNALLVTILVFAVLQMAVQLLFFLHLGRGPKPLYNVVFFFATAGIIVVTIGASLFIMDNLYRNMGPTEVTKKLAQDEGISQVGGAETGACQGVKENHKVTITDETISPAITRATRCDTLTLINETEKTRDVVFGSYPIRESYGGEDKVTVRGGYPKTFTLNETGTFNFYDITNPKTTGSFSVTE
jgi:cytochrome o ubiquinol oxidase subunit IV